MSKAYYKRKLKFIFSSGESKTLIFKSASDYSRLTISKAKGLDKLTMCAAVMGSGVLLQYSGVSSLTGKDLYIATGEGFSKFSKDLK